MGQALCILSVARAQRARGVPLKAKKAAERALRQFQELGSDLLAAEALELLVQSMIALEQRKEALEKAKHERLGAHGAGIMNLREIMKVLRRFEGRRHRLSMDFGLKTWFSTYCILLLIAILG